jgi:hypothetical protein
MISAADFFGHHRRADNVLSYQRRGQEHGKEGLNPRDNTDCSWLCLKLRCNLVVRSYWFAAGTATATADYDFGLIRTAFSSSPSKSPRLCHLIVGYYKTILYTNSYISSSNQHIRLQSKQFVNEIIL